MGSKGCHGRKPEYNERRKKIGKRGKTCDKDISRTHRRPPASEKVGSPVSKACDEVSSPT